jgi:hypothetical protein
VRQVQDTHGVSERRSCAALGVDRSSVRYRSTKADQAALRLRIRDLARTRVRYGYYRIYILLRREGWMVNHKRIYRLYREDGLSLRLKRPRRHVSAADRERQPAAGRPNELWSMDFVSDALFDGRRLRALTVVDVFTRSRSLGLRGRRDARLLATGQADRQRLCGVVQRAPTGRVPQCTLVLVPGRREEQDRDLAPALQ